MSRFSEELKVIPRPAWVVAVGLYVVVAVLFELVALGGARHAPVAAKVILPVVLPLALAFYVLMVGYINGDARRRGMRYVMWTLLAIFIPNAIGIILYFVLREPMAVCCPQCAAVVKSGYAFCPHCGGAVRPACPQCKRSAEPEWRNCPHCGTALRSEAMR